MRLSAAPPAPHPLRVMTWNIKSLGGSFGGNADAAVTSELAAAIRAADPDIVVLQEVDRLTRRSGVVDQTAQLAQLVGASDARFAAAMPRGGGEYGVAMLVRRGGRIEPDSVRVHRLTKSSMPFAEPRVALEAVIQAADGARLRMITTHLSLGPVIRPKQLDDLAAIANRDTSLPAVLAGDFNTEPGQTRSHLVGEGSALRDAVLGAGLADRDPGRITFPSLKSRPDHVLIAGDVDAISARSYLPAREASTQSTTWREQLSDHRALIVDLALQPTKK